MQSWKHSLLEMAQFRCNGSDGYPAWLDNTLDIRETANPTLDATEYDFRVFDNPVDLHALVELKNRANNRSRVVADYCWKWPSKKDAQAWDIELPRSTTGAAGTWTRTAACGS